MEELNIKTLLLKSAWLNENRASGVSLPMLRWIVVCEVPVESARLQALAPEAKVVHLNAQAEGLAERYTQYATQLLALIQSVIAPSGNKHSLIQLVVPTTGDYRMTRGLGAMLKSAQQENSRLVAQTIVVNTSIDAAILAELISCERAIPALDLRFQQENFREVSRLVEVGDLLEGNSEPWSANGVYLITGGAGGIGTIFAESIAREVESPSIILIGRSPLDNAKAALLERIRKLGAGAEYHGVDVSNTSAVFYLVGEILERHGVLNGILHCAGTLDDKPLIEKDHADVLAAFAPKVRGLISLDLATRDIPLDWFVLFSSVAGILGSVGQSDYAAANGFMDDYALYRNEKVRSGERHGHTLSINWPLWAEGGMQGDAAMRERIWRGAGLVPLQTAQAVQALKQVLAEKMEQVTVLAGNPERMRSVFLRNE